MKILLSKIRLIINIKSQNFCNISQLVQNGKTVQNPEDVATIFNHYFLNIAGKIDAEIPRTRKFPLGYLAEKLARHFFSFLPTQLKLQASLLSIKTEICTCL